MHALFDRQLAKATDKTGAVDLEVLAELVTGAYEEADRDRRRTDRSITLMIEELGEVHQRLVDALDIVPGGIVLFDADDRYVMWNRQYTEIYKSVADKIAVGARFEDVLRAGLARGEFRDAVGREEEWLANRLADHRAPSSAFEQHLSEDQWIRVEERRTADGGSVGIRLDITDLKHREASFRLLLENNPVPMYVFDSTTLAFLAVNEAAAAFYGYSQEQLLGMSACDIRPAEDREEFRRRASSGVVTRQTGALRRHLKADGTQVDVAIYSRPMRYQGKSAVVVAPIDVTERERVEAKLREQKLQLDTAIDNMALGLLMFDAEARLVLWNRRFIEMYGLSTEIIRAGCRNIDLIRHSAEVGVFVGDPQSQHECDLAHVARGEPWSAVATLPNGRSILTVQRPMPNGGWVSTHEDITERQEAQRQIEYLAHHDMLTGLPNRAAFNRHLSSALEDAALHNGKVAILCVDLDRFKEVNDVFGHAVGDEVLNKAGNRLKDVAGGAFVARLGGDEFGIIVVDDHLPTAAQQLVERLQAVMAEEIDIDGRIALANVSIGVAIYPSDGSNAAGLLANGDAALYRAKGQGRGCVCFFDSEMDRQIRERRLLQHELRLALGGSQLKLFYQPQARIGGEIVGFEALLRWQHPKRGLVEPDFFIPLAEDNGLIIQLGERALRDACREAATWQRPLRVAVNLSPAQFKQGDLPALVETVLDETGLPPQRLELEITERVLIDDFTRAVSILQRLKSLGVRIALDDFGTGYSSLSYLQSFPFDKIKIDRRFINQLGEISYSPDIIRAVIGLAHGLRLEVLAEGVETRDQLVFLEEEGCDEIQGFFVGRAESIDAYAPVVGRPAPPRHPHMNKGPKRIDRPTGPSRVLVDHATRPRDRLFDPNVAGK